MESGYDYEKAYAKIMQKVEQEVLQISVGKIFENKNKNKVQTSFGKINILNAYVLYQSPSSFSISSYAQELLCFVGQQNFFVEAEVTLEILKGLKINVKQIEWVCHHYGELVWQPRC